MLQMHEQIAMSKKSEQLIRQDLNKFHPLFQSDWTDRMPMRDTSVFVLPLLEDNIFPPYCRVSIPIVSDYQREVVKQAMSEDRLVFLVPEMEFKDQMNDQVIASRFKGCRGVIGVVHSFDEGDENQNQDDSSVISIGFPGIVSSASWENDLAVATVGEIMMVPAPDNMEQRELSDLLKQTFESIVNFLVPDIRKQILDGYRKMPVDTMEQLAFMITNSPLSYQERVDLSTILDLSILREELIKKFSLHREKLALREELSRRTMQQMGERQKTEFLRAQIKTLQQEISNEIDENDEEELRTRAGQKNWREEDHKAFDKEMRRLLRYAPNSPEYAMQYQYLDTFLNLPWSKCDNSDFELEDVENILNRDHYALDKVKDRIIEQMAVLKLREDTKAPILCLVGPPGVGKTSLGKSVAEALGRKYVRVALGGVHDEAEIRGHRRTYLGSMPGRIISALEKCGTSDPVMVLDEIDKLGSDYKGDPQTALLEVLDPEQNNRFHDNYLDHDYDLSRILFIATANSLDPISGPLLDRMEIIEIGGYVEDEKIEIAKRHLISRNLERHGLDRDEVTFSDNALKLIIDLYTRESGVRQLEKRLAEVMRKIARLKVSNKDFPREITPENIREMLGKQSNYPDEYENNDISGVVTGLAWTQAGGDILFIEASVSKGKELRLTLTGNLGDVMKESATLALQYIKAHHDSYGIPQETIEHSDVHIHVPEGAIPKDGPSAGITMLTSIASALTRRKVRSKLAMTGELTLRGKVLPVGGIKEKILAAKRAGITDVILSSHNRKDIEEISSAYLEGMNFHFVDLASEVLDFALLDELAD